MILYYFSIGSLMNIYCIGRNYALHALELGNEIPERPLVFLKTPSSLRNFSPIEMPFSEETFHYEGELVLKIARDHRLNEQIQDDSIASLSFGIDLTRRAEQSKLKAKGSPWTTAKSFLGSAIVGTEYSWSLFKDLDSIEYQFSLNNEVKQMGNTKDMMFNFETIVKYLNSFSPLKKGDLIFTGTPEGVGEIRVGDQFDFEIPALSIKESGQL